MINGDHKKPTNDLEAEAAIAGEVKVFRPDARIDAQMVSLYLAAGLPAPRRLLPSQVPGQSRTEVERDDNG